MKSSWLENFPGYRSKAVEELIRGREITNRLKLVIGGSVGVDGSPAPPEDLVREILNSFDNTLDILNGVGVTEEVSRFPGAGHVGSPCWDGRKPEDSGESYKSSTLKNRRGCYKRRKTSNSWSRESPSPNLIEDQHAWRKYGQKVILNSKFPRNYFRCTHKFDEGCQALKQVQQIEENPTKYLTTYYGHHTCRNSSLNTYSQLIFQPPNHHTSPSSSSSSSSFLFSFANHNNIKTPQIEQPKSPIFSSSPSIKQELHNSNDGDDMGDDYLCGFDYGDGISSCTSTTTATSFEDIGSFIVPIEFDDDIVFQF